MTSDHEALHPSRRIVRIQRERFSLLQERSEDYPSLEPGERCPHTMMDAPSECDMTARNPAIENDVIRVVERG